jgi:hypothetical protein
MKVGEAIEFIIINAVLHIDNYMLCEEPGEDLDRGSRFDLAGELFMFIKAQGFEQLEKELPAATLGDVQQWSRNYAYSLYIAKKLIEDHDNNFSLLCTFKNTLPQVYDDLVIEGEVLEARLRTDKAS